MVLEEQSHLPGCSRRVSAFRSGNALMGSSEATRLPVSDAPCLFSTFFSALSQAKRSVKEEPRPSSCPCFSRHSRAVSTFPETLDSAGSATAIVLIVTWLSETREKKTKPQFIHGWGLFQKPV